MLFWRSRSCCIVGIVGRWSGAREPHAEEDVLLLLGPLLWEG